jgi:hypothetical protein
VWELGDNFSGSSASINCLKEFQGGGAKGLKGHLAGKSGNISPCTKCPLDIRNYLRELQRVQE